MLKVEIYGPTGSKQIMALLDEGSTVTLLDENVASSIGIKGPRETLNIETIGGGQMKNHDSMILDIEVKGIKQDKKSTLKRVRTIKELKLTPQIVDKTRLKKCHHLRGLLQDVCYKAEAPKLLIGQDNWEHIVSLTIRRGKPGQLVASRTKLGWVIHGSDSSGVSPINYVNTCAHASVVEDIINQPVREHLNIEFLGVQPKKPSTAIDQQALQILERKSQQLEDDRSEVELLWKREAIQLPYNFSAAFNRFQGIEKKLREDAKFKDEYSTQIDLLKSNYAEEVTADCTSNKKWYLPHFPVVHPLKKKLRIVFDAAAKHNGVSLNDGLLTTRAVQIEIVPSLTMNSTIMALRRFAARRGMPKSVDDYKRVVQPVNLIHMKAHFELRGWASNKRVIVENDTEARKSYPEHIGRIKDDRPPRCMSLFCTEGELHTFADASETAYAAATRALLETKHIDNSRPITNLADNSEEEALKPNNFLIGRSSGAARILHFPEAKLVHRENWKSVQRLSDHFRKRLLREYLPTLMPRKTTRLQKGEQLQPGDVVLIVKRMLPRCTWPRGIIETTYPGPDGGTRIVDVATKGGVLRRPSSRILILVPAESPCRNDGAAHEGENVGDS